MTNEETKLAKTIEQLELMNDALRVLRLEILPRNSRLFAVMAEGPLAEIEKLRRQIEEQADLLVLREDGHGRHRLNGQSGCFAEIHPCAKTPVVHASI